ncbi:PPOX class F420-dependent oxidoreductase [Pengzhenrongella phosphoraccumulans]|jgi:uncharacterized protein|uniref:PPOX class F420-dependent oxidoreductase n=1 Tax=Pengzhenrongella phosphoraccumulans TaxID=3114394 RepID=UPI003890D183
MTETGTGWLDVCGRATYVRLTTFRRDGTPVPTPVWVVRDGGSLLVITGAAAGKTKRLRHTPRVLIAPSDMRGRVAADVEDVEATATVSSSPAELERLSTLLKAKYGVQYAVMRLADRVRARGADASVQIRILPVDGVMDETAAG